MVLYMHTVFIGVLSAADDECDKTADGQKNHLR